MSLVLQRSRNVSESSTIRRFLIFYFFQSWVCEVIVVGDSWWGSDSALTHTTYMLERVLRPRLHDELALVPERHELFIGWLAYKFIACIILSILRPMLWQFHLWIILWRVNSCIEVNFWLVHIRTLLVFSSGTLVVHTRTRVCHCVSSSSLLWALICCRWVRLRRLLLF